MAISLDVVLDVFLTSGCNHEIRERGLATLQRGLM